MVIIRICTKVRLKKNKRNNLAMITVNTNINIILNREENHLNKYDSYLEIKFCCIR